MSEAVSHGRGGAGNIGPDTTTYVDGGIHRQGDPAETGGAYSAGRGGAGDIGSPSQAPKNTGNDDDIVPENAKVPVHEDQVYHSGRGGEGNIIPPTKPKEDATAAPAKKEKKKFSLRGLISKVMKSKKKPAAAEPAAETTTTA